MWKEYNMLELEGKRLLVLGGTVSTYDVVSHAKELGAMSLLRII